MFQGRRRQFPDRCVGRSVFALRVAGGDFPLSRRGSGSGAYRHGRHHTINSGAATKNPHGDDQNVYLPPHHEAVHGRDAIREYLKAPLSHGVSDLAFDVTYIKQQGPIAWDVGTYRMTIPQNEGSKREDHGKYLTVWRRIGERWLIAADAWSSDLPSSV